MQRMLCIYHSTIWYETFCVQVNVDYEVSQIICVLCMTRIITIVCYLLWSHIQQYITMHATTTMKLLLQHYHK